MVGSEWEEAGSVSLPCVPYLGHHHHHGKKKTPINTDGVNIPTLTQDWNKFQKAEILAWG